MTIASTAAVFMSTLCLAIGPREGLEQARILANDDPDKFTDALDEAIHVLEDDASLVGDADAQTLRIRSLLTLSRAYLVTDRPAEADAAMDRAIRAALGDSVPAADFGPSLAELYAARVNALGEPGKLVVTCRSACEVIVNARAVAPGELNLPPGVYAVTVRAPGSDDDAPRQATVESAGRAEIVWPEAPPEPPPPEPAPGTNADLDVDRPRAGGRSGRLLPRWAEITGMVLGAGAVGAGAALLAIDATCPGGGDPNDGDDCPDLYETTAAGAATLAVGGSLLITSGALLIVDEVRTRDGQKQTVVGLGWHGRF